jgi:predicted hydrocarbon binding protein
MFGDQGARGVLRRWGRAFAVRSLEARFALPLMRPVLRLLPAERSAPYVLARLLHHLDLASEEQPPTIGDRGEYYILQITDCLYCFGPGQSQSHCVAVLGLLEGLLRWTTGNDHDVTEESPVAPGAPIFKIRKQPIGRR